MEINYAAHLLMARTAWRRIFRNIQSNRCSEFNLDVSECERMSVGGTGGRGEEKCDAGAMVMKIEAERGREASLFTNNKAQASAKEDEASFLAG